MKKLIVITIIALIAAFAQGCDKIKKSGPDIGIAKIISHPSLDATEKGIMDRLEEKGIKANLDFQNANGDMNTAASIATKFKTDKKDLIVGISTPIAVALANAIKDRPIVFSVITDPISAGLVETLDHGYKNITGVVDAVPIKEQIIAFRKIYPFKKLGFIYTNSESNAVVMAETTKKVCEELGIAFVPATITNSSEIKQAAESLVGRVDAFYVISDNALVSGISALTSTAKANKIPIFSMDIPTAMEGGTLYALGFDYYKLGQATGDMIIEILNGKKPADIPIFGLRKQEDYKTLIDLDAAKNTGIKIPEAMILEADYIIENERLRGE